MALSQATSYAVMDYFNQYTYASVTANMIGEIAYTETLTLISTLITAPVLLIGGWTTKGVENVITKTGVKGVTATILKTALIAGKIINALLIAPIKEVFEEIITDGFIETWAERQVELWGGTEDMGFWFSALCTSGRETLSGSYKGVKTMMKTKSTQISTINLGLKNSDNLQTWIAQQSGKDYNSDSKFRKDVLKQIEKLHKDGETNILLKTEKKNSILKIAYSGITTAFKFTLSSMFLGSLTMSSVLSLSGFTSTIKGISASLYGRHMTNVHNSKVSNVRKIEKVSKSPVNQKSDINSEAYTNKFAEQTGEQMPSTDTNKKAPDFVKEEERSEIENKLGLSLIRSATSIFGPRVYLSGNHRYVDVESKQEKLDKFTKSSEIKENIQKNIVSKTSSSQQVHLPQATNTIKSQIYRWKNIQTGKDLTLNDETIEEASKLAGELFGMNRKEKIVFKISDQIIASGNTIKNSEGKKMPIKTNTKFSVILDFLGYTSFNDGDLFASENQIIVTYETFSSMEKIAESYKGLGHIFKWFNYYFKDSLDKIVLEEVDAELFDKVHEIIVPIVDTLKSRIAPNIKAMTKTHFMDSFTNPFTGDVKEKFDSFVNSLYDSIIKPGFSNREKTLKVLEDRLYFVALDSLMRECGIDDKTISIETLKANIENFVTDPNKILKMYMDFFSTSYGKDKTLDFFIDTILASTLSDSVAINRRATSYYGNAKEREFLLDLYPERAIEWFNLLISKLKPNEEIPTITINTRIIYNPDQTTPGNNLGGLDYSGVKLFYGGESARNVDPPGSIDFGKFVVASHIKSTLFDSITSDKQWFLADGIANDGVSVMIDEIRELIINGESLLDLPPKYVELIATFAVSEGASKFLNPQTKGNVETILETFFSKEDINLLRGKLAAHEVLLVNLVKLINLRLTTSTTRANIRKQITEIFAEKSFQESILVEASKAFVGKSYFLTKLKTGSGFKDLLKFITKSSNLNKLVIDQNGRTELSFLFDYDPHFRTQDDISLSDFKTGSVFIVSEKQNQLVINEPKTDSNLKVGEPLHVCHSLDNKYSGAIILVPLSLLNKISSTTISEGFRADSGAIHTNIFVSDKNNKKLISKLKFTSTGYEIRKSDSYRPRNNWASKFMQYSELYQNSKIIGFQSEFLAAYTFITGENTISTLQETTAEVIQLDRYIDPLPSISAQKDKTNKPKEPGIFPFEELPNLAEDKLELFANFIDQIAHHRNTRVVISNLIKGLHDESRTLESGTVKYYTDQYYKDIFNVLDPESSSIPNAMKNIRNYYLDSDDNPITEKTSQFLFYDTFLKLIQDKIGHELFEEFSGLLFNLGQPLTFSQPDKFDIDADFDLLQTLNKILATVFSFNGLLLLKAGIMTIAKSGVDHKVDYHTLTQKIMGQFLGVFKIKTLHTRRRTDVKASEVLRGTIRDLPRSLWYYSSIFLFGYIENVEIGTEIREMYIAPVRSFATDLFENYPNKELSRLWYEEISTVFLKSFYSDFVRIDKRSMPNSGSVLDGKQTIFEGLMDMISDNLEKRPMPSRTGDIGSDANKRKVAKNFMGSQFLRYFYAMAGSSHGPQYMTKIKNMMQAGVGNELVFGKTAYSNPLFHLDSNPGSGFRVNFDLNRFTSEQLQLITWAIRYDDKMSGGTDPVKAAPRNDYNKIIQLQNIVERIKDPIVASYDRLREIFYNAKDDSGDFLTSISVNFKTPSGKGNDKESTLKNGIFSNYRGEGIKTGNGIKILIQRDSNGKITNLDSFNRDILSIIHYLTKYPYSYIIAKQGHMRSSNNLLYASLTEIFSEDYIKTVFEGGESTAGHLTQFARDNYGNWQNGYFDGQAVYHPGWNQDSEHWASGRRLWLESNIFPVYLFNGANSPNFGDNDFAEYLINLFASLSGDKTGRYKGIDKILMLA